jgi:microsomal epoxide hydrolase
MSDATGVVRPFRVGVDQAVLDDLADRLDRARWPDQIPGSGWEYGTDMGYLRRLCGHWRDGFDWRATEAALNSWPQFTTEVDTQRVHFIHARSPHPAALPLLLTHGWPGSVLEFMKVLGPLTDPTAHGGSTGDAFHVVCPSMPGYTFSGPTHDARWDLDRVAIALAEVMGRLGYQRFGAQGGDWGAGVATSLARLLPERMVGIHLNPVSVPPPDPANPLAGLSAGEREDLARTERFVSEEMGYRDLQATKPQTLAYGLHDSPIGLAAWIVEKFRSWSDCQGDVESRFTRDELLGNITAYWVTGTIGSSTRLYFETRLRGLAVEDRWRAVDRIEVPTGCAIFPAEIRRPPRFWAERRFNVTRWTTMPSGGHFAALEEPGLLVDDVRAFFRPLR